LLSARKGVDGRIFYVDGRQLSAIRTQDLPQLTLGICGFQHGFVAVERCYKHQVGYVRLFARTNGSYEMFVLSTDWNQLIPYFESGALTPFIVAPQSIFSQTVAQGDLSNHAEWDAPFYNKVYATLRTIFTQSYPTSRL